MNNIKRPHNSPAKLEGTYYSRHKDSVLKRVTEYQKNHIEERKQYMRNYAKKNKDKLEEYRKSYNKENEEYQKEYFKKYDEVNKEKRKNSRTLYAQTLEGRFVRWRNASIQRNKEWSITIDYLRTLPLKCYYTGMDLTFESNKINTISLDRIDSSKGYHSDNVVLCMAQVNIMKNSMDNAGFIELCRMVYNHMSSINTTF